MLYPDEIISNKFMQGTVLFKTTFFPNEEKKILL